MEPIRKRFFVDGVVSPALDAHAKYLKPAYKLLDEVRAQMPEGIEQYRRHLVLEDGTQISAARRFGQPEISINYATGGGARRAPSAYCVWEGNSEQYVEIQDDELSSACIDATGRFLYAHSFNVFGDDERYGGVGPWFPGRGAVHCFDAATMGFLGKFDHSSGTLEWGGSTMSVDLKNNVFTSPFSPDPKAPVVIAYWSPGDMSYQSFKVGAGKIYGNQASGQYSNGTGHCWSLSQHELMPGQQANAPFFIDVFDTASFGQVGSLELALGEAPAGIATSGGAGVVATIHWAGLASFRQIVPGRNPEAALPPPLRISGEEQLHESTLVMNNAGTKAYLSSAAMDNAFGADCTTALHRWTADGGWEEITPDGAAGPWGISLSTPERYDQPTMFGKYLAHDPETDATAFLMPDGSGVWIFDGKNCFDVTMPPFHVKLEPPIVVNHARACQLYKGIFVFELSSSWPHYPRYTTIGKAKIGRLFQRKIEQF